MAHPVTHEIGNYQHYYSESESASLSEDRFFDASNFDRDPDSDPDADNLKYMAIFEAVLHARYGAPGDA
jgi:hypothetical protein